VYEVLISLILLFSFSALLYAKPECSISNVSGGVTFNLNQKQCEKLLKGQIDSTNRYMKEEYQTNRFEGSFSTSVLVMLPTDNKCVMENPSAKDLWFDLTGDQCAKIKSSYLERYNSIMTAHK
jgi:hypothetical protein